MHDASHMVIFAHLASTIEYNTFLKCLAVFPLDIQRPHQPRQPHHTASSYIRSGRFIALSLYRYRLPCVVTWQPVWHVYLVVGEGMYFFMKNSLEFECKSRQRRKMIGRKKKKKYITNAPFIIMCRANVCAVIVFKCCSCRCVVCARRTSQMYQCHASLWSMLLCKLKTGPGEKSGIPIENLAMALRSVLLSRFLSLSLSFSCCAKRTIWDEGGLAHLFCRFHFIGIHSNFVSREREHERWRHHQGAWYSTTTSGSPIGLFSFHR